MQLFALLIATCAPALVAAGRKPGEMCAPYPGAFCDEGLECVSCHAGLPGAPGVIHAAAVMMTISGIGGSR
ncbi:hypothetical protein BDV32DRAFT_147748 [Aspergillus pseudonomiae]|uniref:Uncharacterized protein n=1 Tax=Aspergillus pseudonomiae TaxID=1506151 RepID=A0A5N6I8I7_9EURO|nr:uncharacterized protein BDV37DRAFT_284483 [Aspergillus pseudonomiae]KAB8262099.1 hypothetical protein BDV32DRAFT_147748 [Aspergillus pseudonomiae]KAE8402676.1 hypothetical protein BDV37DRAFT_284483 [Aspergillus pseudonomiae]